MCNVEYIVYTHNRHLINYELKKFRINMQNVGLSARCGCIIYNTIAYLTANILVCPICQKLVNCA
jgi:hypothetical protein